KAARGRGFDVITPTMMRADQWRRLDLLQAWEIEKLPIDNVEERYLKASERDWTWDYGLYHLPHLWGTEALAYQTERYQTSYGQLSLGDLWAPEVRGSIMGRPHSMMAGIGRYLASQGILPPFEDAYRDEKSARSIWSEVTSFAIEHKDWVRLFWNDSNAQKEGFLRNGVVLGQTWDGPIIELKNEGQPVNYMAPKEGAFAWMDGFSMPVGATNIDQAYALISACYEAENAGIQASLSGYNATVKGVDQYISAPAKKAFAEAYPEGAMENLWWWPAEPQWYADIRDEYRDAFVAA
ncbi:MAG: extracellular solute-binding protein, partial [Alphaproteobacteria bacterium]|nr:extracellular solute-binding protein [Alphaproteobacteria bacterium]